MEVDRETKGEVSRKRKREGENGEHETVVVERRCVNPVSAEAFDIFSQEEDSESCGNSCGDLLDDTCRLSDCGLFLRLNRSPFLSPKSVRSV